jgi:hypothetical protein
LGIKKTRRIKAQDRKEWSAILREAKLKGPWSHRTTTTWWKVQITKLLWTYEPIIIIIIITSWIRIISCSGL